MRVNGNPIFTSSRHAHNVLTNLNKSTNKLSSGSRINAAGDDAAGLAIGTKLNVRVNGLNQAVKNLQIGQSMVHTAEAGLETIGDILQRLRTLALQASNETLTNSDRNLLNEEVQQLVSEIDRSAGSVKFNGLELLTGYIDWNDWQTDINQRNVEDIGLIGNANFGIYNVTLNTEAVAQQQTSAARTGTFVENQALTAGNDTIANATVAAGKYAYAGGNWTADFAGTNIEMMHIITADGAALTEGTDYRYTHGSNGANESTNTINILTTGNTIQTINNENATTSANNVLNVTHVITNLNVGDTITVADALVDATTTGTKTVANSGISYSLDTESETNYTAAVAGAIAGSTQTINVAAANANMQVADANLNSFNVTAMTDTSAQMSGFTAANNGFIGNQVLDTIASGLTSTVNVAGQVTVSQTTGTFTAGSLTVGAVTVTDARIQNENITSDGTLSNDGGTAGDVHQFTVSGSNISATKITSLISDSAGLLTNLVGNAAAVQNGNIGDYYFDSSSGQFTVKVTGGTDISTGTINYTADWQWSAGNTNENANNTFNLAAQTTAKGGALAFAGGETVTYNNNITYHDDEFESITLDNTGAIAGTNFVVTGDNDGAAVYGIAADYYNSGGVQTNNTLIWSKDDIGFGTGFSVDYTYGINYLSAGFNVSENLNGTVAVTKTSGNTTSQFMDTANGDSSFKMSYNFQDMYVNTFQIVNPGNLTNGANWNINLNTVKGTGGADITGVSVNGNNTGRVNIGGAEQYVGDLSVDYTYSGDWTINAINRNTGAITFDAPAGTIAPRIDQLVGNSAVQVTYNTFKDDLTANWYTLGSEAILSSTQINTNGETDNFTTPYTAANVGSADTGTPSSLKLTADGTNWLSYGTRVQVDAGAADYTVEGRSIRLKNGIAPGAVRAYYVTDSNTNAATLNATDILGNTSGAANAAQYTTANQGVFKGFYHDDMISFTVDGRQYDIEVKTTDTMQDVIDRINSTSQTIYNSENLQANNANLNTGNSGNAPIWAWWDSAGQQIVISSRDENNENGYKGSRFEITINDNQIGPGSFLNFAQTQAAVNPEITVVDPNGNSFTSVSSDGSYFFNNGSNEVDGISGVRIKLKETAAAGSTSIVELLSFILHSGSDAQQQIGLTMIDMRAGALGVNNISVATTTDAQNALTTIDTALSRLLNHRATLGAVTNRIEHTINANQIQSENTLNASSRIMDTDMAAELTELTKAQLMQKTHIDFITGAQRQIGANVLNIFYQNLR